MIKIYKLKTILKLLVITILIITLILMLKNKIRKPEILQTSNNNENSYKILVDVEDSKLFLFENNKVIKTYKCSGGKWSTPSPIGTWRIKSKAKWGEGFRTVAGWDLMFLGVSSGIHGTLSPYSLGWASSHGCIRMNNDEVAELYKIVPIGTKVTIVDRCIRGIWKRIKRFKIWNVWFRCNGNTKKAKRIGIF